MKREYISLNFIYFSQNFRYISLNCKCNHLNYGHSGYLISDLLLNCRYFSSSFEYISLHALFYQCTSLRSEFDLVYFFSFTCKKYHSPHLQGGLGENWLRNYLEDPIVVELKLSSLSWFAPTQHISLLLIASSHPICIYCAPC